MAGSFLHQKKIAVKAALAAAGIIFLFLFPGASSSINAELNRAYSYVHGQSLPDTNIVIINITQDDIDKVGPWPLKRSYYALLIKSLTDYNVKKIGLEVFLSARFTTQTIYDNLLTKEIKRSGRVVLGSVAGTIYEKDGKILHRFAQLSESETAGPKHGDRTLELHRRERDKNSFKDLS